MKAKNITRYTYEKTAFQGWRLCIHRQRAQIVKYFPDKKYGGRSNDSFRAAITMRNDILEEIARQPTLHPEEIFANFR